MASPLRRWTAGLILIGALIGPSARSSAAEPSAANKPGQLPAASAPACFGILGAVACPGVYELPAECTFGQLVRQAGGMTAEANDNARVFRGGRVVQQLYLASSESVALSPRDLVVVERRARPRSADMPRRPRGATTAPPPGGARVEEVQIGLVNLVDRPVVMTLSREETSLARILERLRQPAELLADVQVVASDPRGAALASARAEADPGVELLQSGTVLIFPARRVELASLPPLPEPIGTTQSGAPRESAAAGAAAASAPSIESAGLASDPAVVIARLRAQVAAARCLPVGTCPPASADPGASGTPAPRQDRFAYGMAAVRGSLERLASPYRNFGPGEWEHQRLLAVEREHAHPYVLLGGLAGTAVAVILITIASMSLRWLNAVRSREPSAAPEIVPRAPAMSEPVTEFRPIRVDANLTQTRLGLDLAIFERVRARQAAIGAALSDPTPKAA
jgi:hypothetical protein